VNNLRLWLRKFQHDEEIDITYDDEDRMTIIITDKDGMVIGKINEDYFI
jgi:hypothetical protein